MRDMEKALERVAALYADDADCYEGEIVIDDGDLDDLDGFTAASAAVDAPAADSDQELYERIIGSSVAYRGKFLHVDEVEVELPNGRTATRDIVRHPGAAAIIAIDAQGRMLIERQYRTPFERVVREIPAGKLEVGEDPLECARRELEEETGYYARSLRYLFPFATAMAYSDELLHLFLATDLVPGEAHLDEGELLTVEWVPVSELLADALAGRIEDSKTLIAILLCAIQA